LKPNEPEEIASSIKAGDALKSLRAISVANPRDPTKQSWVIRAAALDSAKAIFNEEVEKMPVGKPPSGGVGRNIPARTAAAVPKCKRHGTFMKYNPANDQMECKTKDCPQKASRKLAFQDAVGAEVGSNPAVYRGGIQFVVDKTGELYLYLVDANAMVSVEGIVEANVIEEDVEASSKQASVLHYIAAMLPEVEQTRVALVRRERAAAEADAAVKRAEQRDRLRKAADPALRGQWDIGPDGKTLYWHEPRK
jgi:hypothetical protein